MKEMSKNVFPSRAAFRDPFPRKSLKTQMMHEGKSHLLCLSAQKKEQKTPLSARLEGRVFFIEMRPPAPMRCRRERPSHSRITQIYYILFIH